MRYILAAAETIGWLSFLYLGGAGAFELIGGRRVRASVLLAGAVGWIVLMFLVLYLARNGGVAIVLPIAYAAATAWLARKVHATLGKPDLDIP
ncbi:MAG TPA: hypothetical protein VFV17_04685 [Usitatibacteraceae bacterium]|nr:hypothetical protein [Usitatibacteraceae bacterium]